MVVADFIKASATFTDRSGLDEIEISCGVGLQIEDELVEVLCHHHIEVKGFVSVALAVAIGVTEFPDAIAASNVDFTPHDLQPERMIKTSGKPTPGDVRQPGINP